MEINLDEIRNFKGTLEEIPDTKPLELGVYNLIFLGEMSMLEKIVYSLYVRNFRESEKICKKIFRDVQYLEQEEFEDLTLTMEKDGSFEERLAIQKIQKLSNLSDSWYFFLEDQIRLRFNVHPYRSLLYLPGYFITSFLTNKEICGSPYLFEKKEDYLV